MCQIAFVFSIKDVTILLLNSTGVSNASLYLVNTFIGIKTNQTIQQRQRGNKTLL